MLLNFCRYSSCHSSGDGRPRRISCLALAQRAARSGPVAIDESVSCAAALLSSSPQLLKHCPDRAPAPIQLKRSSSLYIQKSKTTRDIDHATNERQTKRALQEEVSSLAIFASAGSCIQLT